MTHAHTMHNTPGYLPENDLETFDTFREAVSSTVSDVADYVSAEWSDDVRVTHAEHGELIVAGERQRWVQVSTTDDSKMHDLGHVYTATECDVAECAPHVGHFSRLGGTWWCDTCDSPYCELA